MTPGKRRKLTEIATPSLLLPPNQKGIQSFGTVGKAQRATADAKKAIITSDIITTSSCPVDRTLKSTPKKRKLELAHPRAGDEYTKPLPILPEQPRELRSPVTTRTFAHNESAFQTPTKGARDLLARFDLELSSSPVTRTRLSTPSLNTKDTPPTSPCSSLSPENASNERLSDLPTELQDLINLHASFLTAISLHYAHHGMSTPVDLKLLTKSVERAWGKRSVTTKDMQMVIGLMDQIEGEMDVPRCNFKLKNFGLGRIVLENSITARRQGFVSQPFDELLLRGALESTLCRLWRSWCGDSGTLNEPSAVLKSLPLAPITTPLSVTASGLKAQRRLEDLKAGAITIQEKNITFLSNPEKDAKGVNSRGMSLLERMKAKELHQSKLPTPLSREELSRRAALQRVDDVAGVLRMLKTFASAKKSDEGSPNEMNLCEKSSFSMSELVQKVKDSAKTPIPKEEVEICLQLLADELAVDWIKSLLIGKMKCIVVYHDRQPAVDILKSTVKGALQGRR